MENRTEVWTVIKTSKIFTVEFVGPYYVVLNFGGKQIYRAPKELYYTVLCKHSEYLGEL